MASASAFSSGILSSSCGNKSGNNRSGGATTESPSIGGSVREKLHDAVSALRGSGSGDGSGGSEITPPPAVLAIREAADALFRVLFAPCAGEAGNAVVELGGDVVGGAVNVHGNGNGNVSPAIVVDAHANEVEVVGGADGGGVRVRGRRPPMEDVPLEVMPVSVRRSSSHKSQHSRRSTHVGISGPSNNDDDNDDNNNNAAIALSSLRRTPPQPTPQKYTRDNENDPDLNMDARTKQARSLSRLKKLGARHQLAGGHHAPKLAEMVSDMGMDMDRDMDMLSPLPLSSPPPVGPSDTFDDGISALSSRTFDEMERRERQGQNRNRRLTTVRVSHLNFAKGADINIDAVPAKEEGFFGSPFRRTNPANNNNNNNKINKVKAGSSNEWMEMLVSPSSAKSNAGAPTGTAVLKTANAQPFPSPAAAAHATAIVSPSPEETREAATPPPMLARGRSNNTRATAATDDTDGDFERAWREHETHFWENEHQDWKGGAVGSSVPSHGKTGRRTGHHGRADDRRGGGAVASAKERARRLRELSRSRSRSDGTGSSESAKSHPHDTVPVFVSDVVGPSHSQQKKSWMRRRRKSSHDSAEFVPGSEVPTVAAATPFPALDYGEI